MLMFLATVLTFLTAIFAVFGRDNLRYDENPPLAGLGLMAAVSVSKSSSAINDDSEAEKTKRARVS